MVNKAKLAIIAGGGDLPQRIISAARVKGYTVNLITFHGIDSVTSFDGPRASFGLAEFGAIIKTLKAWDCRSVCFAGYIDRPDFSKLKPDLKAMTYFPGAVTAARKGDDHLLQYILSIFSKEGFNIVAPQDVCDESLMPYGYLGDVQASENLRDDIKLARHTALYIGAKDIGQCAVVCDGLVLAVEAQEGTNKMLERVSELPLSIRGSHEMRRGVLAKIPKPNQDKRIDLPTIGLQTIQLAVQAGLAGIVLEATNAFVLSKDEVISSANKAGLFILGVDLDKDSWLQ